MLLKIYEDYNEIVTRFLISTSIGDRVYSKSVDSNTHFIVCERYTFRNGNRMTLSIVLNNKEGYVDAHVVAAGGGRGVIFKSDWGAGSSYQGSVISLLKNSGIKYQIVEQ